MPYDYSNLDRDRRELGSPRASKPAPAKPKAKATPPSSAKPSKSRQTNPAGPVRGKDRDAYIDALLNEAQTGRRR